MNTSTYLIQPNQWVKEDLLIQITGMTTDEIRNYRNFRWIEGVHFKRASSRDNKTGRQLKYNRIEIDKFSEREKVA
ncbi:excisionase family protein [Methylophaga sp.]|uniref:excisionase family protein n=1 Tax=Gammaproteobacteria TaxID=1236 RepID=UPI003A9521F7